MEYVSQYSPDRNFCNFQLLEKSFMEFMQIITDKNEKKA
jgi:hypothetical protein